MNLEVGTDLFQNTDGTIEIEGVPQIQITLKPSNNGLLINFAMFDESGKMLAKMVDSTLSFNERRAYEVTNSGSQVTLTHVASKNVVLQVEIKKPNVVSFTKGGFHSVKGHLLEVSSTRWKIDKQQSSGTTIDAKGGAAKIG